tara:strand:+ start:1033 stop:1308 length:276 start_codon:yes stop_codon:yes gene_type:complete
MALNAELATPIAADIVTGSMIVLHYFPRSFCTVSVSYIRIENQIMDNTEPIKAAISGKIPNKDAPAVVAAVMSIGVLFILTALSQVFYIYI